MKEKLIRFAELVFALSGKWAYTLLVAGFFALCALDLLFNEHGEFKLVFGYLSAIYGAFFCSRFLYDIKKPGRDDV